MADVYILSAREYLGNSEWGCGCDDISILGVYDDFEKAKDAFKSKVLEVAESLADSEDEFEYTEDTLFECNSDSKENYGWDCCIGENWCEWVLVIPETEDFDYGFWFNPIVTLQKHTIK